MITIRPGSHVRKLILLLATMGEMPMKSVRLLGSERSWKVLIYKLNDVQEFRLSNTGEEFRCRLISISGKGRLKSIRLYKGALPLLEKLDPRAYEYYMDAFSNHHFSGDERHIDRNHRVAEVLIMAMRADMQCYPPNLPDVLGEEIQALDPEWPCFYIGRDLKKLNEGELNKTKFTRLVGLAVSQGRCHAVYNCRHKPMEWFGQGEYKARVHLSNILAASVSSMIYSAILFGQDYSVALESMNKAYKFRKYKRRFDGIYQNIYYVPLNEFGIRLLKTLLVPDRNEIILDMLFSAQDRERKNYVMGDVDALVGEECVISHLDGDISRLIRFKERMIKHLHIATVICFPEQEELVRKFMGDQVKIVTVTLRDVEEELGLVETEETEEEE